MDHDELEQKFYEENFFRVANIVNNARKDFKDKVCPIDMEDFCDLYFNGGGCITRSNEVIENLIDQRIGKYYCHYIECMDQGFKTITEDKSFFINK